MPVLVELGHDLRTDESGATDHYDLHQNLPLVRLPLRW